MSPKTLHCVELSGLVLGIWMLTLALAFALLAGITGETGCFVACPLSALAAVASFELSEGAASALRAYGSAGK